MIKDVSDRYLRERDVSFNYRIQTNQYGCFVSRTAITVNHASESKIDTQESESELFFFFNEAR